MRISGSSINHLAVRITPAITTNSSKWPWMQPALSEHTHSIKWETLIRWVSVFNVSGSIRHSLQYSAQLKGHFIFSHLLNRNWRVEICVRMSDLIFEIPFDLDVSHAKTVNIFVERETGKDLLVWRSCWWSRFFRFFFLLLRSISTTDVGHIVFLIAVAVTLRELKVL